MKRPLAPGGNLPSHGSQLTRKERQAAAAAKPGWMPVSPVLIASNAQTLRHDTDSYCPGCSKPLCRAQRVATLSATGQLVHVACAGYAP